MGFPENLARLRRERGLTQATLAESLDVRADQISIYESGRSEPSLGVLRQLAVALSVSCDELVFGADRLEGNSDLQLAFEATLLLDPDEQTTVRAVLDALLLAHRQRHSRGEGPRAKKQSSTS
jgi:transcriptional regulator with XRE-family HTH domain